MLKALSIIMAMAVSALFTLPAMANFAPAPSTGTISGTLNLSQTINITCNFTADYSVNAAGDTMTITNQVFSPGSAACAVLGPIGAWTAVDAGSGTVDITVNTTSVAGTCDGTITGVPWNNTVGGPTFSGQSVPGEVFGTPTPCFISGQLSTSPLVTN